MKQLTPMQEAIEKNRKNIEVLKGNQSRNDFEKGMLAYAHAFEEDLKSLLLKEQQVIEDAFFEGQDGRYIEFDKYYNTKFNND